VKKKITILTLYPKGITPGPRFRYEQYLSFLEGSFQVQLLSFFSINQYQYVHRKANPLLLTLFTVMGYLKRYFVHFFQCFSSDYIFIYRDTTPFGPPIYEWLLTKILRKKIILDFDDAIWMSDEKNKLKKLLRYPSKTTSIIRWAHKVSCGNHYLAAYAMNFNPNVFVIPTTIDTEGLHNQLKKHQQGALTIGWTGSHSTLKYLEPIVPVLQKLEQQYHFTFIVICNKDPKINLKNYTYYAWNINTEIEDLLKIDIGIMPLPNDEWSKGKCGFKALQYMSLGIPAIASPVGVNVEIISDGENGYLCDTEKQWLNTLEKLLNNETLRTEIGLKGKLTIDNNFSVIANREKYIQLFE
jgi:glycosyltransferase involved in cell wall biosynthesis